MGDYSFGFNGKELDKEGMGGGASTYDYGFRIYNSALAKFLSVDPLSASYPWYTPYQFAGNKPIIAIDLDGLEEIKYHIRSESTILSIIRKSEVLNTLYNRLTDPKRKDVVHVGEISPKELHKSVFWGGSTYPFEELKKFSEIIKHVDELNKYNIENPESPCKISELLKDQYDTATKVLKAVGLTTDDVDKAKNPIHVVILNKDDTDKIDSQPGKIEVLKNFIHELDAHIENFVLGEKISDSGVIDQHLKYHGVDKEKAKNGDVLHKQQYDIIKIGKSPSPENYIEGSDAYNNYKAIKEAVISQ